MRLRNDLFAAVALLVLLGNSCSLLAQRSRPGRDLAVQIPQVQQIEQYIQETWDAHDLRPSPAAGDGEWCRRVYLDVIGRIPTVEELNEFVNDKSKDKRVQLVDRLVSDDRYTEEFARNWTTIWSNLLIGRTGGNDQNSLISREGMAKYLRDSFARNKPYDKMVYELVSATGSTQPGSDDFNGATNFLIDKVLEENASQATAATGRLFLGLQVQCTQCHNHPFNEWKQQTYWEMNAFFRQTRVENGGRGAQRMGAVARLSDGTFRGESGNVQEADLFYELRNGLVKVAFPVFVDGTEISKVGEINEVNRRQELAHLIVDSRYMDRALVNRMWGHFLGYGFTRPVDDLGPHNRPSHPELLDYLAGEFRNHDFDLAQLMKWIVLSRPYALSSQMNEGNSKDDPLLGEPPKFSHFYLRQMRAEELYESLLVASGAHHVAGSYEEQERRKNMWLQQFARAFGTDEGDETTSFNGTIPQVLMMFNGELIRTATDGGSGTLLEKLAADSKSDMADKTHHLFLAGLSRRASSDELKMAQQLFAARGGDVRQTLQDVWWVVLNSNEFIFNH